MKHPGTPEVRKARLEDLPILQQFLLGLIQVELLMDETIKKDTTSYYDLGSIIQSSESDIFVVELDTEIVASGYAKIMDDKPYLKHKKQGYLGFMFVPKKYRGRGFNKLVLDALFKWCKDRDVFEIRLDVYEENTAAQKAYIKAGFKKNMVKMRVNIENLKSI